MLRWFKRRFTLRGLLERSEGEPAPATTGPPTWTFNCMQCFRIVEVSAPTRAEAYRIALERSGPGNYVFCPKHRRNTP